MDVPSTRDWEYLYIYSPMESDRIPAHIMFCFHIPLEELNNKSQILPRDTKHYFTKNEHYLYPGMIDLLENSH